MAKSLRSKTKRAFRAKKRDSGVYAATEAARLNRLNTKLITTINQRNRDGGGEDAEGMETPELQDDHAPSAAPCEDSMNLDGSERQPPAGTSGSVSTHGSRGSRREEWRKSKGMDAIPKRKGMNRQGGLAARRRAGRPSRRR
ncbi:hypothetical protein V8B97DRAFT_2001839 [Scleroderma yunnanense]